MTEPEYIIRTEGLNKKFKTVHAVKDLDIHVEKGDIYLAARFTQDNRFEYLLRYISWSLSNK